MIEQLNELYREVILDHYQSPRGKGNLPAPTHCGEGKNPLCGDEITLQLMIAGDVVSQVMWNGHGCSICMASASMLAEQLTGKPLTDVHQIAQSFIDLMHGATPPATIDMGDLPVLEGVKQFPVRIKCALLPWTTLGEALKK